MNRKLFLSSLAAAAATLPVAAARAPSKELPEPELIVPPYLKVGDAIGITCPAGDIQLADIEPARTVLESWGFQVVLGATVGKKDFTFGGTDQERVVDFQQMLDDRSIRAILCARGGYGSVRIVDQLDFSRFAREPKWIVGFSDVTVFHDHLSRNYHIASLHSKMCNSFPDDLSQAEPGQADSILSIRRALMGETMTYIATTDPNNRLGQGQGPLIGGNLKTIESLAGTKSDILTAGKILFLEDTGEYLYSIDRMFWNLKRTGKLDGLQGLVLGGFNVKPDDPGEEFGQSLYQIVLDKVKSYGYPVCFNFPVGHQKENYALKCGIAHRLDVKPDSCILAEL
jgi:muramoyltetrapeptide carboxypeptidase